MTGTYNCLLVKLKKIIHFSKKLMCFPEIKKGARVGPFFNCQIP